MKYLFPGNSTLLFQLLLAAIVDDHLLFRGRRKTLSVGFIISAKSVLAISKHMLYRENNPFQYVLTYRFSQDSLEMFFRKIKGRFGWNNNPNVLEFKYALRAHFY